jgi:hypothetical protein
MKLLKFKILFKSKKNIQIHTLFNFEFVQIQNMFKFQNIQF